MDMVRPNIQVKSMDNFSCQEFKKLFSGGNRNGVITTTNNGRKYNVVWETSTNTISVERDLTNIDGWTRASETLSRWVHGDFTSNADKWANRFTIQQQNVALAKPLDKTVTELLIEIEELNPSVEPGSISKKITKDHLNEVCTPLAQLLEEKKQHLYAQAQQLSLAVNKNLASSEVWTQKQKIEKSVSKLQEQVQRLKFFIIEIQSLIIGPYSAAMASIDFSRNSCIYAALSMRLTSVAAQIQQIVGDYFNAGGNVSQTEINNYRRILENEGKITSGFADQPLSTYFVKEHCGQDEQKLFNYHTHHIFLINTLLDPTKKWNEIKGAEDALKLAIYG